MDPAVIQALVQQAAAAEARLAQIEGKIQAGGGLSAATVSDLHELRALLVEAQTETQQLRAERDEALKAVRAAEAEVAKRDYRILHLARSLKAAQQQGSS